MPHDDSHCAPAPEDPDASSHANIDKSAEPPKRPPPAAVPSPGLDGAPDLFSRVAASHKPLATTVTVVAAVPEAQAASGPRTQSGSATSFIPKPRGAPRTAAEAAPSGALHGGRELARTAPDAARPPAKGRIAAPRGKPLAGTLARRSQVARPQPTLLVTPHPKFSPHGGGISPGEMKEYRRKLDDAKKEVREIQALEAKVRWEMDREERREVIDQNKAEEDEIREWRKVTSEEMKAYVAEKMRQVQAEDLEQSKEFQEFKRIRKQMAKEEDRRHIEEAYLQHREDALWRVEFSKLALQEHKEIVENRFEDLQEIKDIRLTEKVQAKVEEQNERTMAQSLEMDYAARQLQEEREALLRSLEFARSRQSLSVKGGRGGGRR